MQRRETGCLEWTGPLTTTGYGLVTIGKLHGIRPGSWKAHRLVWTVNKGEIPDGGHLLHSCDNPLCCNVEHLRVGTDADNKADMMSRGRVARGSALPHTKLTVEKVIDIRRRAANGERNKDLAKAFSLDQSTVSQIVSRKRWSYV